MALIVIDAGLSTTVQDGGRPGYREWGVPLGGAFDRGSADLANALLGNPPGCAVLELTLFGGSTRPTARLALALAGAPMEAKILRPNSTEYSLQLPSSFSLGKGTSSSWAGTWREPGRTWPSKADGKRGFTWAAGRRNSAYGPASLARRPADDPHSPSRASRPGDRRATIRSASSPALTAGLIRNLTRSSGPAAGFKSARRATGWAYGCKAIP